MHPYVTQQIMDDRQRELIAEAKRARQAAGRTHHKPAKGSKGQTRHAS